MKTAFYPYAALYRLNPGSSNNLVANYRTVEDWEKDVADEKLGFKWSILVEFATGNVAGEYRRPSKS